MKRVAKVVTFATGRWLYGFFAASGVDLFPKLGDVGGSVRKLTP
jgi:hypothetical protein